MGEEKTGGIPDPGEMKSHPLFALKRCWEKTNGR